MKNKKIRTSKIIMWLFILLFIYVIFKGVNYDFSSLSYMDTAIFCACITAVSGILGAILVKYLNNSNAENIPRIQMDLYRESLKLRLKYNEDMLNIKRNYGTDNYEIEEIENDSHMDEVCESILNQAISELDSKSMQSHEDVHIQSY